MFELTPILVLLIIFGSVVLIIYLGIRRKERMAMLEKGVDASVFFAQKEKFVITEVWAFANWSCPWNFNWKNFSHHRSLYV